jgi:metallo-beta-lactamase family protein
MTLKLTFLGGAGTVTGSKYLLERDGKRILVDCGLFQGYKTLRLRNWAALPGPPGSLDAVVITHAHLDHTGYLPLLVKNGYHGPIFCTAATKDLCGILLPDSGHLQEQDAEFANRRKFSKHHPALPLYTEDDARRALGFLRPVAFDQDVELPGGGRARFYHAGHILGAATVAIEWGGVTTTFSGDIGRYNDPLMLDPQTPERTDYLLMESTYGDRCHDRADPQDILADIIGGTVRKGGTVIVPAFAVGRAQMLLYHIAQLKAAGRLQKLLPIFLDSPMAIDATEIFQRHAGDQKLSPADLKAMGQDVHYVHTGDESKALTANPVAKVIISASGMATGGRVLHHLEHYAPDPKNAIVFTGFQAGGTRGASMVAGSQTVKMHGTYVPVRASVHNLTMLSAHADKDELLRWAGGFREVPKTAFIVHGEPAGSDALRHALAEQRHWACIVPEHHQTVELS